VNTTLTNALYDTVLVDGLPVHTVYYGGRPVGPTYVLVHGLGGSHLNWDLIAPLLVEEGYVYSLDLPGFGRSEPMGRDCSVEANVRVLEQFIDKYVPGPVVLVGNSMGGAISTLLAASRPDLVEGLVLIDPAAPPPGPGLGLPGALWTGAAFWLLERLQGRTGLMTAERKTRLTAKACGIDPTGLPDWYVERNVALLNEREDDEGYDTAFFAAARSCTALMVHSGTYRRAMDAVQCPVLLIHGDRDKLVNVRSARDVARRNPDWSYRELAGVGHCPQIEVPFRTFNEIIHWMGETV
jgi:pimeloyl-ACP methyl ester carboxylesterase